MRIALISYEFAGLAGGGGIGTYVRNASAMLAARGHSVEVFCGPGGSENPATGVRVHAVGGEADMFSHAVLPAFAARHRTEAFDVVEGPEYGADAAQIARAFPGLPLVVKLHTPGFLVREMDLATLSWRRKARFVLGALRRGRMPRPYWRYDSAIDAERLHALSADEITAPSQAVITRVDAAWALPLERTDVVPNAFLPDPRLLAIEADTQSDRVLYLGRLEVRKGVLALAQAIPLVLQAVPKARFRLVGRSLPHPETGEDLAAVMRRLIGPHGDRVEFIGAQPYDQIPRHLADCDICVLPSRWEASGYACQEAMAAARGVVGGSAGGMAEILDGGRVGVMVPPDGPEALAAAIIGLLRDRVRRVALGRAARAHVLSAYGAQAIAPLQEASYRRAILHARQRGLST